MSSLLLLNSYVEEVAVGYTVGLVALNIIGVSLLIILYRILKWIIRVDEKMSVLREVVQTYKQLQKEKEDCLKEGIIFIEPLFIGDDAYFYAVKRKVRQMYDNILKFFSSPQRAYADLIDKISGRGTWKRNPWVIAYSFELID